MGKEITHEDFFENKIKRSEQRKQKISNKYPDKERMPWWSYSDEKPWKRFYLSRRKKAYKKYSHKKFRQEIKREIYNALQKNNDPVLQGKDSDKLFDLWWYVL